MSDFPPPDTRPTLRDRYRVFRKQLVQLTPFVKRARHNRLQAKLRTELESDFRAVLQTELDKLHSELRTYKYSVIYKLMLSIPENLASRAIYHTVLPIEQTEVDELCLFVTFAPEPELKPHVIEHIHALVDEGIAVILIINTEHTYDEFHFPDDLLGKLSGLLVRQNIGFDFAAWSHAYCLTANGFIRKRLYLINDSIVGPLESPAYKSMILKVRASRADMVGLTKNSLPHWHLQSFFLVFNSRLLNSRQFDDFLRNVLNMPKKEDVIDCYETRLTQFFVDGGFKHEAIFPYLAPNEQRSNDTHFSWDKLIEIGFPFVKSSVLQQQCDTPAATRLIPERFRKIGVK